MKTAISIPDEVFQEVEHLAKTHRCSRSRVFVLAVEELLEKKRSRRLLEALNRAYGVKDTAEEKKRRKKSLRHFAARVLKREKY
jgi:predicted CopG family antitoxin